MRYAVVIEKAGTNYSAYVPDLPGCIATGSTVAETETSIREAIELHLSGMREDGTPIPPPSSQVEIRGSCSLTIRSSGPWGIVGRVSSRQAVRWAAAQLNR